MAYVGQCRGAALIAQCEAHGIGEMTQPNEYPPRRAPWALDNGAFKLWRSGKPFDGVKFMAVATAAAAREVRPDFVVCPDVVAGGLDSLKLSLAWAPQLRALGHRLALVVQDGMTSDDVAPHLHLFDVVFVGGTLSWKLATMALWADLAHQHGLTCHVGRMGGRGRVLAAKRAGVDSVDSCVPLFSKENMATFVGGLSDWCQLTIPGVPERPHRFVERPA